MSFLFLGIFKNVDLAPYVNKLVVGIKIHEMDTPFSLATKISTVWARVGITIGTAISTASRYPSSPTAGVSEYRVDPKRDDKKIVE